MNKIRQQIRLAILIAAAISLCGCAATQQFSDEDRAKVKAVRISGAVVKAPESFLLAPGGANAGLMFGAVGGLAASGPIDNARKAFDVYLDKNAISIEKIVLAEIEIALRASGNLTVAGPGETGLPEIRINVLQYGFGVTHLLGSKVVPVLWIKCDMVDGSGKLLWSANDRMLPSIASPMESTPWEQLRDNPKQIEEEWRKAARYIAKMIVDDL